MIKRIREKLNEWLRARQHVPAHEVFARAGDEILCPNGHPVLRFKRTVYDDEQVRAGSLEAIPPYPEPRDGEVIPLCRCGAAVREGNKPFRIRRASGQRRSRLDGGWDPYAE